MQLLAPNLPAWFYSWFYCLQPLRSRHSTKYNLKHIGYLFLPERQDNLVSELSKKNAGVKVGMGAYGNTITNGQFLCLCFLFRILIMFHSYQENIESR